MGKAFEKQTKTIEDQGKKQTKTIEDQGEKQIKAIKKYVYKTDEDPIILGEKEIYNMLIDIEEEKIKELDKKVKEDNSLVFKFKGNNKDENSRDYDNALVLMDKIKHGATSSFKEKKEQEEFISNMREIKKSAKKIFITRE